MLVIHKYILATLSNQARTTVVFPAAIHDRDKESCSSALEQQGYCPSWILKLAKYVLSWWPGQDTGYRYELSFSSQLNIDIVAK